MSKYLRITDTSDIVDAVDVLIDEATSPLKDEIEYLEATIRDLQDQILDLTQQLDEARYE